MQQFDQITLQGYQIEKYEQYFKGDLFKVYKAKIVQTGEIVALKEQSKITIQEENLLRLQQIIKQQHIIEIKIFDVQKSRVFVIIEKMKKSFYEYIFENEFKQKKQIEKCLLFLQIVQAIQEFHGLGIFHRNLKPIDFVVCEDQNNQITLKLLDFGLVQFLTDEDLNKSLEIGSIEYLAPEILDDQQYYDKSVDVWSLGVIWYQMLTGDMLFKSNNNMLTQESIYQIIEQNGNQIDRNIQNLIKQMLVIKSQERISLDQLNYYLRKFCQNQPNFKQLQNSEQGIIDQLSNYKRELSEKLDQQFQEELQNCLQKKQIFMKMAKLEIIQDEINQNIQNLIFFNQQELNVHQVYVTSEQDFQSLLDKWSQRDDLIMQFQTKYFAEINEMILNQEKKIEQRWEEKKNEIVKEITLQIKQQLLLDYNLQMSIQENQIREEQANLTGPEVLQQQIIQFNKKQLDLLSNQLENSQIKTQKQQQYEELRNMLDLIQKQQDQSQLQTAEKIRKFQKQLINMKIEVDSIEKEIELDYIANKLQRDRIMLENKSQNLFRQYKEIVDVQVLKLDELQRQNYMFITQNQKCSYFSNKIQKLALQKQDFNQEIQKLFQGCQNQQIETLLPQIQRIQFFNENLIKITNYEKQSNFQLNSSSNVFQTQNQSYLQQQLDNILSQSIDLFGFIQGYLQAAEIYCTDIKEIDKQLENIKNLHETLNQQSEKLFECQRKLQENNLIIEENRKEFIQKGFYDQGISIFSEEKYEEFTYKLKEIINLKESVSVRIRFFEDKDFYKYIIDQWNGIHNKREELQQVLQEVTKQTLSYNNIQLQEQIDKIKVLIIQLKLQFKTIPSIIQIQRFNQEYKYNQTSYIELFTLVVYIKYYNCQRYLNRYFSSNNKALVNQNQQSQVQNQVQINQQNSLNEKFTKKKQEELKIQKLMEEYLKCLKRQREPFEMVKLNEDNEYITILNQEFENTIKQKQIVKLRANLQDQNLINEIMEHYQTFEFSPLIFFKKISEYDI